MYKPMYIAVSGWKTKKIKDEKEKIITNLWYLEKVILVICNDGLWCTEWYIHRTWHDTIWIHRHDNSCKVGQHNMGRTSLCIYSYLICDFIIYTIYKNLWSSNKTCRVPVAICIYMYINKPIEGSNYPHIAHIWHALKHYVNDLSVQHI